MPFGLSDTDLSHVGDPTNARWFATAIVVTRSGMGHHGTNELPTSPSTPTPRSFAYAACMSLPIFHGDTPPSAPDVLHVRAGEGLTKWVAGDAYTMKALGANTGGTLSVFEAVVPPGGGPPVHSHRNEDEAFYILSGELEMHTGDRAFTGTAGDFVFVPRGHRHAFTNTGAADAAMLFLYTPAGFERFFIAAGDDPRPGERPEPWSLERIMRVAPLSEEAGMDVFPDTP